MIIKKFTGLALIFSLLFTGCQFPSQNQIAKDTPDLEAVSQNDSNIWSEYFKANHDFTVLKTTMEKIPENSMVLYLNGSETTKKKLLNAISQGINFIEDTNPNQPEVRNLQMAEMGIAGAINDFDYAAVNIKFKKAGWSDQDVNRLFEYMEAEDFEALLDFVNENMCVTAAIKTNSVALENFINAQRVNFPPFLKHEGINDTQTFMLFGCESSDLDFVQKAPSDFSYDMVVSANGDIAQAKQGFQKFMKIAEEKMEAEIKQTAEFSEYEQTKKQMEKVFEALQKINYFDVSLNTSTSFWGLKMKETGFFTDAGYIIEGEKNLQIKKEFLIGKSMKVPMFLSQDADYFFATEQEGNLLLHHKSYSGLGWNYFLGQYLSIYENPIALVALAGIASGVMIAAINPGKQLAETRNAKRNSNVNTILNALYQYSIDNNGKMPPDLETHKGTDCENPQNQICRTDIESPDCSGLVDLSMLVENELYLVNIPQDAQHGEKTFNTNSTGYHVVLTENNRIEVCAPLAEKGVTISVTR